MSSLQTVVTEPRAGAPSFDSQDGLVQQAGVAAARPGLGPREWAALGRVTPKAQPGAPLRFGLLVGDSAVMPRAYDHIARVAPTNATVLIVGQSGTGKELVARAVHDSSRHHAGPYVAVNCASMSPSLVERTPTSWPGTSCLSVLRRPGPSCESAVVRPVPSTVGPGRAAHPPFAAILSPLMPDARLWFPLARPVLR